MHENKEKQGKKNKRKDGQQKNKRKKFIFPLWHWKNWTFWRFWKHLKKGMTLDDCFFAVIKWWLLMTQDSIKFCVKKSAVEHFSDFLNFYLTVMLISNKFSHFFTILGALRLLKLLFFLLVINSHHHQLSCIVNLKCSSCHSTYSVTLLINRRHFI